MRRTVLLLGDRTAGRCTDRVPTDATAQTREVAQLSPARQADFATLKRVTEPFRNFARADSNGYSAAITGCMVDPDWGDGLSLR
jgi:hypothetical protein